MLNVDTKELSYLLYLFVLLILIFRCSQQTLRFSALLLAKVNTPNIIDNFSCNIKPVLICLFEAFIKNCYIFQVKGIVIQQIYCAYDKKEKKHAIHQEKSNLQS